MSGTQPKERIKFLTLFIPQKTERYQFKNLHESFLIASFTFYNLVLHQLNPFPQLMYIAAVYDRCKLDGDGSELFSVSVITTSASSSISWLHHRMPVRHHSRKSIGFREIKDRTNWFIFIFKPPPGTSRHRRGGSAVVAQWTTAIRIPPSAPSSQDLHWPVPGVQDCQQCTHQWT